MTQVIQQMNPATKQSRDETRSAWLHERPYLLSPGSLHNLCLRVEHLLPVLHALCRGAVCKGSGNAVPIISAKRIHQISQRLVLLYCGCPAFNIMLPVGMTMPILPCTSSLVQGSSFGHEAGGMTISFAAAVRTITLAASWTTLSQVGEIVQR